MKIILMSGAYKNAGDFLISTRCKELIRYVFPQCEIKELKESFDMSGDLEEINQFDAIVFGGGPFFEKTIYPFSLKLTSNLENIKPQFLTMGGGWNGKTGSTTDVFHYYFSKSTNSLLKRIENDSKLLSCRDWHTVEVLKNNGFASATMMGCPAWYNISFINLLDFRTGHNNYKNICISDPAYPMNFEALVNLIDYLKITFPNANCKVIFHRGIGPDAFTSQKEANLRCDVTKMLTQKNIQWNDISYNDDGFKQYDNCDLHIGFRVHAHIYNLSRRNRSILIEEDGRGAGVNDALGLPALRAYADEFIPITRITKRIAPFVFNQNNKYLISQLNSRIEEMIATDGAKMRGAFGIMRAYFNIMCDHIASIGGEVKNDTNA